MRIGFPSPPRNITDAQRFFARFSARSNNDLAANPFPAADQIAGGVINQKDFISSP